MPRPQEKARPWHFPYGLFDNFHSHISQRHKAALVGARAHFVRLPVFFRGQSSRKNDLTFFFRFRGKLFEPAAEFFEKL